MLLRESRVSSLFFCPKGYQHDLFVNFPSFSCWAGTGSELENDLSLKSSANEVNQAASNDTFFQAEIDYYRGLYETERKSLADSVKGAEAKQLELEDERRKIEKEREELSLGWIELEAEKIALEKNREGIAKDRLLIQEERREIQKMKNTLAEQLDREKNLVESKRDEIVALQESLTPLQPWRSSFQFNSHRSSGTDLQSFAQDIFNVIFSTHFESKESHTWRKISLQTEIPDLPKLVLDLVVTWAAEYLALREELAHLNQDLFSLKATDSFVSSEKRSHSSSPREAGSSMISLDSHRKTTAIPEKTEQDYKMIVDHFMNLFSVEFLHGAIPKMEEISLSLGYFEAAKKSIKVILGHLDYPKENPLEK